MEDTVMVKEGIVGGVCVSNQNQKWVECDEDQAFQTFVEARWQRCGAKRRGTATVEDPRRSLGWSVSLLWTMVWCGGSTTMRKGSWGGAALIVGLDGDKVWTHREEFSSSIIFVHLVVFYYFKSNW
ncbi:AcrB/AcrD/AcrF family protein [Sesbania bispinosa]|nr:AcrB/AcrD/AcrF family protein [Sesbania bispinosa]